MGEPLHGSPPGDAADAAPRLPGWFAVELVFWACLLLPRLVYALWQLTRVGYSVWRLTRLVDEGTPVREDDGGTVARLERVETRRRGDGRCRLAGRRFERSFASAEVSR